MEDPTQSRLAQMLPKLTDKQLARIALFAKLEKTVPGQILFKQGEENIRFFVVFEGEV